MSIKNYFSANVLLIIVALLLMILPAFFIKESASSFIEYMSNGGEPVKQAVSDFFITDTTRDAGYTPIINESEIDRSIVPAGMTPQLAAKFMIMQASVDWWVEQRGIATLEIIIAGIFCAIGVVALLLGIGQLSIQRKLDKILKKGE